MAYRATTSFTMKDKNSPRGSRLIGEGTIVTDEDKAVKKHPHLFVKLEDHLRAVEEASAAPGGKRDLDVVIGAAFGRKKRGK